MHPGSITHTQTLQTHHTLPSTNPALIDHAAATAASIAARRPPAATCQPLTRWRFPRPSPPPTSPPAVAVATAPPRPHAAAPTRRRSLRCQQPALRAASHAHAQPRRSRRSRRCHPTM
eukprot:scaffold6120_cov109-Isochrysis_galbana.AAC.7